MYLKNPQSKQSPKRRNFAQSGHPAHHTYKYYEECTFCIHSNITLGLYLIAKFRVLMQHPVFQAITRDVIAKNERHI
jgi:hypothetical protein